jgi:26S proteasome regulatory subunit N2
LAALVVSKIYFYLGALDESVEFALNSKNLFDEEKQLDYVNTIIGKLL